MQYSCIFDLSVGRSYRSRSNSLYFAVLFLISNLVLCSDALETSSYLTLIIDGGMSDTIVAPNCSSTSPEGQPLIKTYLLQLIQQWPDVYSKINNDSSGNLVKCSPIDVFNSGSQIDIRVDSSTSTSTSRSLMQSLSLAMIERGGGRDLLTRLGSDCGQGFLQMIDPINQQAWLFVCNPDDFSYLSHQFTLVGTPEHCCFPPPLPPSPSPPPSNPPRPPPRKRNPYPPAMVAKLGFMPPSPRPPSLTPSSPSAPSLTLLSPRPPSLGPPSLTPSPSPPSPIPPSFSPPFTLPASPAPPSPTPPPPPATSLLPFLLSPSPPSPLTLPLSPSRPPPPSPIQSSPFTPPTPPPSLPPPTHSPSPLPQPFFSPNLPSGPFVDVQLDLIDSDITALSISRLSSHSCNVLLAAYSGNSLDVRVARERECQVTSVQSGSVVLQARIYTRTSDLIDLYHGLVLIFSDTKLYFGQSFYSGYHTKLVIGTILTKLPLPPPPPIVGISITHSSPISSPSPPPDAVSVSSPLISPSPPPSPSPSPTPPLISPSSPPPLISPSPPPSPSPPAVIINASLSSSLPSQSSSSTHTASFSTQYIWIGAIGAVIATLVLLGLFAAVKRWNRKRGEANLNVDHRQYKRQAQAVQEADDSDLNVDHRQYNRQAQAVQEADDSDGLDDVEKGDIRDISRTVQTDHPASARPASLKADDDEEYADQSSDGSNKDQQVEQGLSHNHTRRLASALMQRPTSAWRSIFGAPTVSSEQNDRSHSLPTTWKSIFGAPPFHHRSSSSHAAPSALAALPPRRQTLPPLGRAVMEKAQGTLRVNYPVTTNKMYEKEGCGSIKLPLSYGGGMSGGGGGGFNPSSIPPLPPNHVRRSQSGYRSDGGGKDGKKEEVRRHFMARKPAVAAAMKARASETMRKELSRGGSSSSPAAAVKEPMMWSMRRSIGSDLNISNNPLAADKGADLEVEEVTTPRGDQNKVLGNDGLSLSPGTQERRRSAKKPLSARKSERRMSDELVVGSMIDDGILVTEDLDMVDEMRLPAPKKVGNWVI